MSSRPINAPAGEQDKRTLQQELTCEGDAGMVEIHPNVGELCRRKLTELQTLIADETTRTQAMDVIRGLAVRIDVRPSRSRGQAEVTLSRGTGEHS